MSLQGGVTQSTICPSCGGKKCHGTRVCHSCARRTPGYFQTKHLYTTICFSCLKKIGYNSTYCNKCWPKTNEHRLSIIGDRSPSRRPEVREKLRKAGLGDNNPSKRPEVRAKNSASCKLRRSTPEERAKISAYEKIAMNRPEVRAKMSAIKKIVMNRPEVRSRVSAGLRIAFSRPEVREKMSIASKLSFARPEVMAKFIGPNSSQWKGGISYEPYSLEFNETLRRQIRDRYDHTCQLCGARKNGKKLAVHHIDYVKKHNYPSNLTSLCPGTCHTKTNNDRDYWTFYFQEKWRERLDKEDPDA